MSARRVAIVIGAGSGNAIGHAIACEFARNGWGVAVVGRSKSRLNATASELQRLGARALACRVAKHDPAIVAESVASIREHFGRIDALVIGEMAASAGTRIVDLTQAQLHVAFETGFAAPLAWMQACHDELAKTSGSVVYIGGNIPPRPGMAALEAAQAALDAARAVAAAEWKDEDINVETCEAFVKTAAVRKLAEEHPQAYANACKLVPNGHFEELGTFAQRVVGLCTNSLSQAVRPDSSP